MARDFAEMIRLKNLERGKLSWIILVGLTSSQGPLETGEEGRSQPGDDLTTEEKPRQEQHCCVWRLRGHVQKHGQPPEAGKGR